MRLGAILSCSHGGYVEPWLSVCLQVHLAKWRETTVAVKVLSNAGLSDSMEEEFPEQGGSPGQRHPLYESLQKVGWALVPQSLRVVPGE